MRIVGDALDLPKETLTGIAPARGAPRRAGTVTPARLLDAGTRLERDALAAALAHPSLHDGLAELTPEHFEDDLHRRFRAALVDGAPDNGDLVVTYRPLGTKWGRYNINGVPRCCLGAMLIGRRVW